MHAAITYQACHETGVPFSSSQQCATGCEVWHAGYIGSTKSQNNVDFVGKHVARTAIAFDAHELTRAGPKSFHHNRVLCDGHNLCVQTYLAVILRA